MGPAHAIAQEIHAGGPAFEEGLRRIDRALGETTDAAGDGRSVPTALMVLGLAATASRREVPMERVGVFRSTLGNHTGDAPEVALRRGLLRQLGCKRRYVETRSLRLPTASQGFAV